MCGLVAWRAQNYVIDVVLLQDAQLLLHMKSPLLAMKFSEELIWGKYEIVSFVDFADNKKVMNF